MCWRDAYSPPMRYTSLNQEGVLKHRFKELKKTSDNLLRRRGSNERLSLDCINYKKSSDSVYRKLGRALENCDLGFVRRWGGDGILRGYFNDRMADLENRTMTEEQYNYFSNTPLKKLLWEVSEKERERILEPSYVGSSR